IGLVVAGIEEWSRITWSGCNDCTRRDNPQADRFTASSIDVTRILQRLLGVDGMHASRMFVRRALLLLREHFPERPLTVGNVVHAGRRRIRACFRCTHAAAVACSRLAAYA